jgi:hypothetical protein
MKMRVVYARHALQVPVTKFNKLLIYFIIFILLEEYAVLKLTTLEALAIGQSSTGGDLKRCFLIL